jgi:hypothetical protein
MNFIHPFKISRGHGDSPIPASSQTGDPSRPYDFHSWHDFAADVLQVTDWIRQNSNPKHIVGVGLSKGGAALTIAEVSTKSSESYSHISDPKTWHFFWSYSHGTSYKHP